MLAKAAGRGAEAIIADLEDAVAPERKGADRAEFEAWLAGAGSPPELWARANGDTLEDDLVAVCPAGPDGVFVPEDIERVVALLADVEAEARLPGGSLGIVPWRPWRPCSPRRYRQGAPCTPADDREVDLGAEVGVDPRGPEWWPRYGCRWCWRRRAFPV